MLHHAQSVIVTCDRSIYPDTENSFQGVDRVFIDCPANGIFSILHDLLAFFAVFLRADRICVLGVSGGIWFPLFRFLCDLTNKQLLVNVDGVEWERGKFSKPKKMILRIMNYFAQRFAHKVIIDNEALPYLYRNKTWFIPYPGDHVMRMYDEEMDGSALTVCRIEPENNIDMMIEGALLSKIGRYIIIGNWNKSNYGIKLRNKYKDNERIKMVDPIYDPYVLAQYRERCAIYIHGHSVGGTNPSLIEMIYYDCDILCFDVKYHHFSVGDNARYFSDSHDLLTLINNSSVAIPSKAALRKKYSREIIAKQYLNIMK